MICTVNICTRLRHDRLKQSIRSIFDTAAHPDNVEVILSADRDDLCTLLALPEILTMDSNIKAIIGKPLGYTGYPERNWEMCQIATGDWIWHFDDDATVKEDSYGWDERLALMPKKDIVVLPEWDILGGSGYHKNSIHPFMFLPNGWWKPLGITKFSQPFDDYIFRHVQKDTKWETRYLMGVSTFHERRLEDSLNKEQQRF